jgi:anhydro-N-acetylmuramic acid kinase
MSELAIGLMSGTSLDGVDAALVRIHSASRVELVRFHTDPYQPGFRDRIRDAIANGTPRSLTTLHVELGERFARAAGALLADAGARPADLSFVASHGQTIWHVPRRATLQLGDPAVIAERLGVRVVSDFRSRDVAAGGEGAPLVPIADVLLFGRSDGGRALLNLGGMANVTWVPRRGHQEGVIAFDTGPGVAVIDAVARTLDPSMPYDTGGMRASRGRPADGVVDRLLDHPYFFQRPPKSTGREVFGDEFAARLMAVVKDHWPSAKGDDCLATAVRLTARSVADQITRWLPVGASGDVVASGGGARNNLLMTELERSLHPWAVKRFSEVFFDGDAKEAVAFALLGWLSLNGQPGNVPAATGAKGPRVLGRITPA